MLTWIARESGRTGDYAPLLLCQYAGRRRKGNVRCPIAHTADAILPQRALGLLLGRVNSLKAIDGYHLRRAE